MKNDIGHVLGVLIALTLLAPVQTCAQTPSADAKADPRKSIASPEKRQLDLPSEAINYNPKALRGEEIDRARAVAEQMRRNRGPDDAMLQMRSWAQLTYNAQMAMGYSRRCDDSTYAAFVGSIIGSREEFYRRKRELEQLNSAIYQRYLPDKARFEAAKNKEDWNVTLGKNLALKDAAIALELILEHAGEKYDQRQHHKVRPNYKLHKGIPEYKGGQALRAGAKVVGVASTLKNLVQLHDEIGKHHLMEYLQPVLLEQLELMAYLDGMIKQYEAMIAAHDKLIDWMRAERERHLKSAACQCLGKQPTSKAKPATPAKAKPKPARTAKPAVRPRKPAGYIKCIEVIPEDRAP